MRKLLLVSLATIFPLTTWACTPSSPGFQGACPPFTQGAFWSTQTERDSELQLIGGDRVVARIPVGVRGITARVAPPQRVGDKVYVVSNDNPQSPVSHLVEFDAATCAVRLVKLAETGLLGFAVDHEQFFTTSTTGAEAHIRKHDFTGATLARVSLPRHLITTILLHGDRLYAFAMELGPDALGLRIYSADDLSEVGRVDDLGLSGVEVKSAVIHGRELIYPETFLNPTGSEGSSVKRLDPDIGEVSELDLGNTSPYLLRLRGDTLWVAHTMMNPTFRPMSEYRHLSRVDLRTGEVTGFESDAGIVQFELGTDRLVVASDDDLAKPELLTYDESGTALASRFTLPARDVAGHHYFAGFFLRD